MKKIYLPFIFLIFVVACPCTHAAGGACPSTANMDGGLYAAPTNCYYVDFASGSDSNSGTTESAPFKHAVGMTGAGGNVPSGCSAGVGWIFKGGVTWDYTIAPWYIGAKANCTGSSSGNDSYGGCTGAGCIYFGVDHSWFTGGAWTRPKFSWGDWSNSSTPTCYYDAETGGPGTGFQPTNFFNLTYQNDIIVDNFEFLGACSATKLSIKYPFADYLSVGNTGAGQGTNYTIENSYFHRAAWNAAAPPYGGNWIYAGSFGNQASVHWTYNVVDFSDSGPTVSETNGHLPQDFEWVGEAVYGGVMYYDHSIAAYQTDASSNTWGTVRDSLFYWASNGSPANSNTEPGCPTGECATHPHIANDAGCTTNAYWYNNVIDTVAYGQMWQPAIANGVGTCTFYVFNNVITNVVNGLRNLNFGSTSAGITFNMFNNTLECGPDTSGTLGGGPPAGTCGAWGGFTGMNLYNTHFITSGSPIHCGQNGDAGACALFTDSAGTTINAIFTTILGSPADIVTQSQSATNGQGYSYTQTYEFSPTSSSGSTVGVGANKTSLCNAMPDANAAAACKRDTTYGVTYNKTNHTAVASTRATNARPSSGNWDVGAYEFSGASGNAPQPPSGLVANVQ